jgi:Mg-chelatase subunit ChlD
VALLLAVAGCSDRAAPDPEPEPLDLSVRAVVDSAEFRSGGVFALDLVPSDRQGNSFIHETWAISGALTAPATATLVTHSQGVQPADTQAVASAILIDNSGSMRFSDPDRHRATAAQDFWTEILGARASNAVALLDFGRGDAVPTPGFDRTVLLAGFTSDVAALDAVIDQIQAVPGGGTPMYAAASEVLAWMDTATPEGAQRSLVAITDGEPSDPELADSLFALAAAHEVRIFAVGVGAAADPGTVASALVQQLATRTGGIYGAAANASELQVILGTLAKSASPERLLLHLQIDPAPAPGAKISGTVTVDGERGTATSPWSFVAP